MHRVIHKSVRDFRPLRYSSRDGHAKGKHVNRRRETPSFCPTLQVLDMLLSVVSVLVVVQPSSEVPEGLMNYPVYSWFICLLLLCEVFYLLWRWRLRLTYDAV